MLSSVIPRDDSKAMAMANVTMREWLCAAVIALGAVCLTLIPYALGYALARPGSEFTGVIMNPEDSQSYFAKMLQGYDGHWLYAIPFTTEEHAPAFIGGFYLLLGQFARWMGVPLIAMWHFARIVADCVLFLATFGVIATFVRVPRERWTAYLLAVFGSGLGWLLFLLNQPYWLDAFPVDFKMPEAHLFFTALTFPHVALGSTLLMVGFWLLLRAFSTRQWAWAVAAGIADLLLVVVFPFLIYPAAVTAGLYWLYLVLRARRVLWREGFFLAIAFVIPAPLLLYYATTLASNPVFRTWEAQAVTLSPPLPHYVLSYGVMLFLGLLAWRRGFDASFIFLWAWVLAVALLLYAPHSQQRRFVQGVQVPLAILATAGLYDVFLPWVTRLRAFEWFAARRRYSQAGLERLIVVLFLVLMSLSNVYVLASVSVTAAVQQVYPLFRSRDEIAAVEWLRANTARSDVVLGEYETGNYIAAHAGNRVVIGHWTETVDWQTKSDQVKRFYSAATDEAQRRDLLARYRVSYVWVGPRERTLGEFDPAASDFMRSVFSNSTVHVYQVNSGAASSEGSR